MRRARRWTASLCLTAQVWLASAPVASATEAAAPADTTAAWPLAEPGHLRTWGLVGSGVGLAAGVGLAVWLKHEADDRYDLYLATANPDRAREHFDAAQRYDRATLIGWTLAQASFVGLVYFLMREDDRPLVPARGEPLVRAHRDGVEVGVVLWP